MGMKPGDMNGNENYNWKRKGVGWKTFSLVSTAQVVLICE